MRSRLKTKLLPALPAIYQVGDAPTDFKGFLALFINIINLLIPVIIVVSLWFFFKGLLIFIKKAGSEKAEDEGKQLMIWGIIILFVMISFFGIVNLLHVSVFGGRIGLPQLPQ